MKLRTRRGTTTILDEEVPVSTSEEVLFGGPLRYERGFANYEDAFLHLNIAGMVRRLPMMLSSAVRLAWQADRQAARIVAAAELGQGIARAVSLVAINHVLTDLLAGGAVTDRLRAALPALIAIAVTAGLQRCSAPHPPTAPGNWSRPWNGWPPNSSWAGCPRGAGRHRGRRVPQAPRLRPVRSSFSPPHDQVLHVCDQRDARTRRRSRSADRASPAAAAPAGDDDPAPGMGRALHRPPPLHLVPPLRATPARQPAVPESAHQPRRRR